MTGLGGVAFDLPLGGFERGHPALDGFGFLLAAGVAAVGGDAKEPTGGEQFAGGVEGAACAGCRGGDRLLAARKIAEVEGEGVNGASPVGQPLGQQFGMIALVEAAEPGQSSLIEAGPGGGEGVGLPVDGNDLSARGDELGEDPGIVSVAGGGVDRALAGLKAVP
jgi:hypothetical protein